MAILIVDDSKDSRLLLQLILRKSGYHELLTAASARDAFAQLGMGDSANTDMEVDLVLMDIMMPEVDGIEACQCIRAVERFRDLPIIMVSAVAEGKYLEAAFNAGAIDYITKPINKIEVSARVRSALSLKRAHAELEEKNQILANESLAKSHILTTVTHELKTPLTSIVGYADRLLRGQANVGELNERQHRYVTAISESSHRLEALVKDLLDISIIEAGKLELTLTNIEVGKQIEEIVQMMQTQFEEKRIRVVSNIPSSLRPVYADQDRFSQVVMNLLSNACKYSPSGTEVTVSGKEVADFVQIDVSDSGIGISESNQAELFTKFFRADNTYTRTESGSGLGLFLSKQLIEAQGGEIWAYSEEGVGSTFSITLPCVDVDRENTIPFGEEPQLGLRVIPYGQVKA